MPQYYLSTQCSLLVQYQTWKRKNTEFHSDSHGKSYLNKVALLADLLADRCSLAVVWLPGWRNISWYSVVMDDRVCLLRHKGTDSRCFFSILSLVLRCHKPLITVKLLTFVKL